MTYESWEASQDNSDGSVPWQASVSNFMTNFMGLSFFASILQPNSYMASSLSFFLLGTIIDSVRRFCHWLVERYRFQYSISAQFSEGDPAYDWIILFLTQENLWKGSRKFRVTAKSSLRKWGVQPNHQTQSKTKNTPIAEYVPTYNEPQLFRWQGYWVEIARFTTPNYSVDSGHHTSGTIYLTVYTREMSALTSLVENARGRYLETSRPNVVVHTTDQASPYGPFSWNCTKDKLRRPLHSINLPEGVLDSIMHDACEFLDSEDWYVKVGIPYRRGYLLYGPPGTGKSSTIYALAGELGLEIYSLSLASRFVDDAVLQRAVAAIPKNSIFLIEDIDCAFPSREDADDSMAGHDYYLETGMTPGRSSQSSVTLSGLLNVLDGLGSEEGKLFFATTNFVDRLDPALIRPGRIDLKIQYKLASKHQATALYNRFYPESYITLKSKRDLSPSEKVSAIQRLAEKFAENVPEHEFSTAELQGYLLRYKKEPEGAAEGVAEWAVQELKGREDKKAREAERKAKKLEVWEQREAAQLQGPLTRLGIVAPSTAVDQPVEPTSELAATTTTSTPNANPEATLQDVPLVAPVPTQPACLVSIGEIGAVPSTTHEPTVNGAVGGAPTTPPTTPP